MHTCPPLYIFHLFIIVGILSIAIANLWREWGNVADSRNEGQQVS